MRAVTPTRSIGFWTATALVIGNMIGSGIVLLPASLAPYGAASLLGWGVTTAGAMLLAVVFAHLARRHARTGGPYAYARLAFGDLAGFVMAWCYWISIWCGNAAIAVAFAGSFGALFPAATATPWRAAICAIGAIWVCTAINIAGIRSAGRVQAITTVLKLAPLVALALVGVFLIDPEPLRPFNRSGGSLLDVTTATVALTLWAFLGLESATIPAEHVENAERTIPRATLFGTAIAAAVTVLACTVVIALLPQEQLQASGAPFADLARKLWGNAAGYVVAAAAAIAIFGTLNGWVLMQGQIPLAAARDGLFPKRFAREDANGTPVFGLLVSSVLATALVLANYGGSLVTIYTFAILLSTAVTLLPYLFSALASIALERGRSDPRATAGRGIVIVGALAFGYSLWALVGVGREALLWGLALLLAGLPIYAWQRLRKSGV